MRFVVINVHSIWKAVWVPQKNDWILSLRYNLQKSIMLFYEAEILSFSKNINSIGPFPDPPIYYCILYVKEKILTMGSAREGWGRRVRELKRQMGLIKWNIIFMWLNMILLLQWSVKQIWWNSEHSMYNLMHSWTWQWWLFLLLFVINWHQKTHVYQEYTDKVYRLISFVAVILQRKTTIFTLK